MPNLFTIPPGEAFADVLARGLLQRHGDDPPALSDNLVLLPTRRAVRTLREAFLRQLGGAPTLLPQMRALGDVDEDELTFDLGDAADALDLPPAIGGLRRTLLLAAAVEAARNADGAADRDLLSAPQAVLLAAELARLLDQLQTDDVPLDALDDLVPDDYARHWQEIIAFLRVLKQPWQQILAADDALDPVDRRNRLLRALATRWRHRSPGRPVIAAGSTGSLPATAELLAVIAGLSDGAVVLPGLDTASDGPTWEAIGPSHPQFAMKQLLARIGATRHQVALWPAAAPAGPREQLLREALRPGETTDTWRDVPALPAAAVEGLSRIDCRDLYQEAGVIALAMRQALETPARTAALITPDRGLARRVASELARWGIEVDDSAGTPLAATPPGTLMQLTAEALTEGLAPVTLLAMLKHPLARAGRTAAQLRALVRRLDEKVLRGPRPAPGFAALLELVRQADGATEAMCGLLDDLQRAAAPLTACLARDRTGLAGLVQAHVAFAEWLCRDAGGEQLLWAGEAGEAAAGFVAELTQAAEGLGGLQPSGYPALLGALMAGRVVRPAWGRHPRLQIWGPLEARLQQADLVILGGLNEGSWPVQAEVDAWLSRPMRARLGLPAPEQRIGLSAHDFVQAAAAPDVILTRAGRAQGAPTVPSRWLLRLDQVLAAAKLSLTPDRAGALVAWQRALDAPSEVVPATAPACRPPLDARPRKLSVTGVETWMRDPYQIYAREVLGLRALEPLAADPGAAERGTAVHTALERFAGAYPDSLPADALERLLDFGREAFGGWLQRPGVRAFWWPRFARIATWFVAEERARRPGQVPLRTEARGALELPGPAGAFTVTARADRIDRLADGRLAIIDYKTGGVPPAKQVRQGDAPQLPLEAAIAAAGGFDGLPAGEVGELAYWQLTGRRPAGEVRPLRDAPAALADVALQRLLQLIDAYDKPQTPYRARPRPAAAPAFSDYDHLARVKEWTAGGPGDL